jgi:hypothetical protein
MIGCSLLGIEPAMADAGRSVSGATTPVETVYDYASSSVERQQMLDRWVLWLVILASTKFDILALRAISLGSASAT